MAYLVVTKRTRFVFNNCDSPERAIREALIMSRGDKIFGVIRVHVYDLDLLEHEDI